VTSGYDYWPRASLNDSGSSGPATRNMTATTAAINYTSKAPKVKATLFITMDDARRKLARFETETNGLSEGDMKAHLLQALPDGVAVMAVASIDAVTGDTVTESLISMPFQRLKQALLRLYCGVHEQEAAALRLTALKMLPTGRADQNKLLPT
jgi:hypothetical protein